MPFLDRYLKCPDEVMIERILHRGETGGRADDNLETAKNRIETFHAQAGQAYRSSNTRAFEIFDFSTFYTRACRVPHTHQRGPQLSP